MSEGFLKPKSGRKKKPKPPVDRTQFTTEPVPPIPNIPDLPSHISLPERAQAMTDEMLMAMRNVMNDPNQPGSARIAASIAIKEIGYGKSTSDAPPIPDKKDKADVTQKILSMLTDAQLEELRANE